MRNIDRYWWVLFIPFFLGAGIPAIFIQIDDESWEYRMQAGIFSSMAMFTYSILKKFGKLYPDLRSWANNTLLGASVTVFIGGFFVSASSAAFAKLPLPSWLQCLVAVIIALIAFFLLFSDAESQNEK